MTSARNQLTSGGLECPNDVLAALPSIKEIA
jgi:hypothetical protein